MNDLRYLGALTVFLGFTLAGSASAQERFMLVYLPETPVESMSKLGEGVTRLARYLEAASPGLTLEVKAFKKFQDARAFLASDGERVALIVSDVSFLLDLPEGFEARPSFRFVRSGRETRRKIVVVKSDSGIGTLAELRGKSLAVTVASGSGASRFLAQGVFRGELAPESWFSAIAHQTDDFAATAAVLYGETDAALVSDDNPLVVTNLGKELTEIYVSPEVSLSTIAVRVPALSAEQSTALGQALAALSSSPEAADVLSELRLDGFRRVRGAELLANVVSPPASNRALDVAIPAMAPVGTEGLPARSPAVVPFLVGVELGAVPIPEDLTDSLLSEPAPPGAGPSPGSGSR